MPKAAQSPTTTHDTAESVIPFTPSRPAPLPSNDAVILALAALHRANAAASDLLEDAQLRLKDTLHQYPQGHADELSDLNKALEFAICAIPAEGLEAALVQLDVLGTMLPRESSNDVWGRHVNQMRDAAHCSVFLAVARATGRTHRDCIGVMIANQTDTFRTDVPALLAEWEAYLGKAVEAVKGRP